MSLTTKEKELVNVGASVATGCKPCTDYHFKKLRKVGASDREIEQAISDALAIRDSAREIMAAHGLQHLGIARRQIESRCEGGTTRIKELVSVAAAFAVNCTSNLEKHIAASRTVGITEEEIGTVLDAANFIKGEASFYVGELVKLEEKYDELQQLHKELQATQAELVQSEKMAALGKLVASVAHELNTPIGAINSAADVSVRSIDRLTDVLNTSTTLDEVRGSPRFQGCLQALQSNSPVTLAASRRILKIVNSLKNFARLDEASLQETDLHEGLESTLTLLEPELRNRIRVVRDYEELPPVVCHPAELNQVFMNLLLNASQAVESKGTITVRTRAEEETLRVEISDTGVGIPPEQIEGIFDPAFTKSGERVKAGIGLFVAQSIVRKHRGELRVQSEVGRGSTFTIVLPNKLTPGNAQERPSSETLEQKASRRCDRVD